MDYLKQFIKQRWWAKNEVFKIAGFRIVKGYWKFLIS